MQSNVTMRISLEIYLESGKKYLKSLKKAKKGRKPKDL